MSPIEQELEALRQRVIELEHTYLPAPARTLPCPKCIAGGPHD